MKIKSAVIVLLFTGLFFITNSCSNERREKAVEVKSTMPAKATPLIQYSVVATYPHDVTSFTEGFLFHNGKLYESTGAPLYLDQTSSAIGIADLNTGKFDKKVEVDKNSFFGEGIVILDNLLYQLTYTNQIGFIYDIKTYNRVGQFGYANKEGWGMTTDGSHLILSDGTSTLTYLNPKDFKVVKTIEVIENGYALHALNELEYIKGFIYANVWLTHKIVKINPQNGEVVGALDLKKIYNETKKIDRNIAELNGIAYDSISRKIMVTGKLWPLIYEIDFEH